MLLRSYTYSSSPFRSLSECSLARLTTRHTMDAQLDQNQLAALIENLHQRVAHIENRPAPVLAPHAPYATVKPNKPSTFDGTNQRNTSIWLFEVELYFKATGTTDPRCVPIVVTFLKGVALTWWESDVRQREHTQSPPVTMWEDFKTVFRHRFLPIEASKTARAVLQTIRQYRSVAGYVAEFMKQLALIPDMAVADQIDNFTRGLKPAVQKEVVLKSPSTLDEAMNFATRCDLLLARIPRTGQSNYRSPHYSAPFYANHNRGSSSYSSSNAGGSQPMELGKMEEDADDSYELDDGKANDNPPDDVNDFNYMQSNYPIPNNKNRVPNITKEEFARCRRLGLCLRCKQPGHIAKNCPRFSSSSYPKGPAQRK